jgi:hypothetical protein
MISEDDASLLKLLMDLEAEHCILLKNYASGRVPLLVWRLAVLSVVSMDYIRIIVNDDL